MMSNKKDISKELLYESVKSLLEQEESHLHLNQHKLFTLFSIGLQFMLFLSTKNPGHYIIRIEDSFLADKLSKRAKDHITRKFLEKITLPRKIPYGKSTFFLDYFHINSWFLTKELPKDRVKGAIVVKDSTTRPLQDTQDAFSEVTMDLPAMPPDYYYTTLQEFIPKTIIISYDHDYPGTKKISFPFIKEQEKMLAEGVTVANHLNLDDWQD